MTQALMTRRGISLPGRIIPPRCTPQTGPQTEFLKSLADITIYGGQAGGGKTYALLMEPLKHIYNRDFGAVIFRRTYPQIMEEGGLWDEATKMYPVEGAQEYKGSVLWRFPSGSRVRMRHLQYDKDVDAYQGSQIPLIMFDQLEQFSRKQFFYMLSRNRSMCGVSPYVRATCNPYPNWLAQFLDWWIGEDGYAREDRAGKVRWFLRAGEQLKWGSTKEELLEDNQQLLELANIPDDLGFDISPELMIKSVCFIPASVYDNKILLRQNPEYLANLMALDLVERERLLKGNWKIIEEAGKVFNRAWFKIVGAFPVTGVVCRYWDFAATEKELSKQEPSFTASVRLHMNGFFTVSDCIAVQEGAAEVDRLFLNTSLQDALLFQRLGIPYLIRWEVEPGSAGKREEWRLRQALLRYLGNAGVRAIDAAGVRPSGDKIARAKPAAQQVEAGNAQVVEGNWNETFLNHLHNQPQKNKDILDAFSGAFNELFFSEVVETTVDDSIAVQVPY